MARTKLVISGVPGVPSQVVPLTPAEEAEFDKHDARGEKTRAFMVEGLARITALVPSWTKYDQVLLNEKLGLLDTPAKRRAARIAQWATRAKKILHQLPNAAAINAIDPTSADPFGAGNGWPT